MYVLQLKHFYRDFVVKFHVKGDLYAGLYMPIEYTTVGFTVLLIYLLVGKVDISAVRRLLNKFFMTTSASSSREFCFPVVDFRELLVSCAAQTLDLHSWSKEKSLVELGANSFDILRLLNMLDEKITGGEMGLEIISKKLFEILLTQPLQVVITEGNMLLRNFKKSNQDRNNILHVIGCKRRHHQNSTIIAEKQVRLDTEKNVTIWRRGQIIFEGK